MANIRNSGTDPIQPPVYQIRLTGHLGREWTDWFEDLTITLEATSEMLFTGPVVDQAALLGVLRKERDLGLPLLSVNRVKPDEAEAKARHAGHERPNQSEHQRKHMNAQPGAQIEPRDRAPRRGAAHVRQRIAEWSPRARARITGVVYLLFFLTALLGEVFMQQAGISGLGALPGDAAATANTLLAHEGSYLVGSPSA